MGRSRLALLAGAVCGILYIAACGRAPQERAGAARSAPSSTPPASATAAAANVEWPFYAGNLAAQRYSPLDQINRDNVGKLEIAWRFQTGNYGPKPESRNEATPLMIGGVLYTTVGVTRNVIAIDPKSGETLRAFASCCGETILLPRKKTGSLASEFQFLRDCLQFIHQTRMYY